MLDELKKDVKFWWIYLIIGILSIGVGIYALCNPDITGRVLGIVLSIDLIVTGIMSVAFIISNRHFISVWGLQLILPILVIVAGFILLFNRETSIVFVMVLFGANALVKAIETIIYAVQLSKIPGSKWGWTLAGGILMVLMAIALIVNPFLNVAVITAFVGISLIVVGVGSIVLSFQLAKVKSTAKKVGKAIEEAAAEENNQQ